MIILDEFHPLLPPLKKEQKEKMDKVFEQLKKFNTHFSVSVIFNGKRIEDLMNSISIPIESNFGGKYSLEYDGKYITLLGIDKNQPINEIINPGTEPLYEPVILIPVVREIRNASPKISSVTKTEIIINLGLTNV